MKKLLQKPLKQIFGSVSLYDGETGTTNSSSGTCTNSSAGTCTNSGSGTCTNANGTCSGK